MRTGMRLLIGTLLLAWPARSSAQTQRPISDFLSTQGTYCIDDGAGGCFLFVPPVANYVGWGDAKRIVAASVDYAGLADAYIESASGGQVSLGTSFSGAVRETTNADGTADVTVDLHARNALLFVLGNFDFAGGPLVLGHRAPEVAAGAPPGLADLEFHLSFTNTAPGAPLPDLIQLFFFPGPGQAIRGYAFTATGTGPAPDGTILRAMIVESGNAHTTSVEPAIVLVR
jgi:hypothetical protein